MEEIDFYLEEAKETMEGAIKHLNIELSKIRAGKASPQMLDGIKIDYYGSPSPIGNVASITTPDPRTIAIKPFERKQIADIERAIINSNIGLSPANDGDTIRLFLPPLTEERRKELAKRSKAETETAKVNIRNIRQDANNSVRKLSKDGASEDLIKQAEERVQKMTDSFVARIDQIYVAKERDIMEV